MSHPSYLQLDEHALGRLDPAITAHAAGCARCGAHLHVLAGPVAIPAWVKALQGESPGPRWWSLKGLFAVSTLAAAAAALLVASPPRPAHEETTPKGSPTVAVYVKAGSAVSLWNGVSPLQAGDAVQLKVRPEGFSRVTVASVEAGEAREVYQGAVLSKGVSLLPVAFTLEGPARDLRLLLIFSRQPVAPEELKRALDEPRRDRDQWTTLLDLTRGGTR